MAANLIDDSKRFFGSTWAGTGETTLFTIEAGKKAVILEFMACNPTDSSAQFSLSVVPSGESNADGYRRLDEIDVPAKDSIIYEVFWPMGAGDFMSGKQETDGALSISVNGAEVAV